MYKYLNLNHRRTKSLFPIPQLNAFINLKFDWRRHGLVDLYGILVLCFTCLYRKILFIITQSYATFTEYFRAMIKTTSVTIETETFRITRCPHNHCFECDDPCSISGFMRSIYKTICVFFIFLWSNLCVFLCVHLLAKYILPVFHKNVLYYKCINILLHKMQCTLKNMT